MTSFFFLFVLFARYKLRNIEETEAAKKLLQERRLASKAKSDMSNIPSSYSADYFHRGRDYAEKLRRGGWVCRPWRSEQVHSVQGSPLLTAIFFCFFYYFVMGAEHPELYKDGGFQDAAAGGRGAGAGEAAGRRQAATDVIMLERFRKRERQRAMRR